MITTVYSLNISGRRTFIKSYMRRKSIRFKTQSFIRNKYNGENFIVEEWKKRDKPNIIVSAHYDGLGAYDNTGGTVGLLYLLDLIKIHGVTHINEDGGLVIAFLDGEESGLLGAKEFIKTYLKDERIPVKGHLSLDGFGIGTHIGGFANLKQIKLRLSLDREINLKIDADTNVFQEHNIPSLHFFSLPYQELKALREKGTFPPSWQILHTKDDTPDKIEEDFLPFVILFLFKRIPFLDFSFKGFVTLGGQDGC